MAHNEGLSNIYNRGLQSGLKSLDKDEQVRFILLLSSFFRSVDQLHYQHAEKMLDEEAWKGMKRHFDLAFQYAGFQEVWNLRKETYSDRIQDYYDKIVAQGPVKGDVLYSDANE